jgi:mono/diheme cytochrome c family protein
MVAHGFSRAARSPSVEISDPNKPESMARMRTVTLIALGSFALLGTLLGHAQKPAKIDAPKLYETNCLACHGPEGNSPFEQLSFTDSAWKHGSRLQDIVKVVTDGVEATPMLAFKEKLSKEEIAAVSKLVRSFDKSLAAKKAPAKKPAKTGVQGPEAGGRTPVEE